MSNVALAPAAKKLIIPYHGLVARTFPESQVVKQATGQYLVVNHGAAETSILRNVGYKVPAPIMVQYDWRGTTPFHAQEVGASMMTTESRGYNFSSMGTGKTLATLYAFDFLRLSENIKHMLIVAPLSTLSSVWQREVTTYMPDLEAVVVHGPKRKREKLLATEAHIYIINFEGVELMLKSLIHKRFDMVVFDEAGAYRNANTDRWKAAKALIANVPRAFAMTGTPTPNAPTDAFGLAKLITPHRITPWFTRFRQEVMYKVTTFRWVAKEDASKTVDAILKPSVRFSLDEDDMPALIQSTLATSMTAEQRRLYKAMRDQLKLEYEQGTIVAANEAVKLSKLMQIACGFAYDTKKELVLPLPGGDRYKIVSEVVDQASKKVLVFCPFKAMVALLADRLARDGFDVATVTGDTTKKERDLIFGRFSYTPHIDVIVAHPKTMAYGLNLQVTANIVVWAAPAPSLDMYLQANARIRRSGQKHRQLVLHLEGSPVERSIYARLKNRERLQGVLLDLLEQGELE